MSTQNGKGDRDRSDRKKFEEGYDRIFGKKKPPKAATKKKPRDV
jgi:hypothetical protein